MELAELEMLVLQGESETLEFKKSTALLGQAAQTLCGFLNCKGGVVLIGVTSLGHIVGQDVTDHTLQEIAQVIAKFEPHAQIHISQVSVGAQRHVIVLTAIFRKFDIPYAWEGRPYQRIGSTTSRMPQAVYQRLLIERDQNNHRWETGVVADYTEEDLDSDEIIRTIRLGAEARRIPEYRKEDISSILDKLGLRKEGQLLNAAVVLFGKKFLPDFLQCELRLARFKGVDKNEFIDQNQIVGNAFYLLEEALMFLRRHLPVAAKIQSDQLERKEMPLFPFEALREALVNALCHRVYSNPGGAISVAVFDDRLEMWNDGRLASGITPADLKKDHGSYLRNPLIATVFYNRGLIEKWGRGTQKIVQLCVEAGHPEPEFFEQANSFIVRFLPVSYVVPHRVSHDLTDRQRVILQVISQASHPDGLSFTEIKTRVQNPPADRTLRDDFQQLKRLLLVRVKGSGRGAKWRVVLKNKAE
jgi:ATP-dependent DNA helicase RecG